MIKISKIICISIGTNPSICVKSERILFLTPGPKYCNAQLLIVRYIMTVMIIAKPIEFIIFDYFYLGQELSTLETQKKKNCVQIGKLKGPRYVLSSLGAHNLVAFTLVGTIRQRVIMQRTRQT